MYHIPTQDTSGQDVQDLVTAPDGNFTYTVSKDVPEGEVSVMVFAANGQQIGLDSHWLEEGLIADNNGGDVTPEPEKPSVPDNGGDVTPEPEKPEVPDNGGDVTPEPEKPAEKLAVTPVANNESATNQQPTYNTGEILAKTATTNNSVILAAIGGIASLVMGLETLISRKK
ncbi:hypothetical protein [Granulicatella balaenopterae]